LASGSSQQLMQTAPPVLLSRQLIRLVRSSDGVKVGWVIDLTVLYDIEDPTIAGLQQAALAADQSADHPRRSCASSGSWRSGSLSVFQ
jgi:hypothetical protein